MLVGIGPAGGNGGFGAIFRGASTDGSRVVFTTAERLVDEDADAREDLYQRTIVDPAAELGS